ncbi:MAG: TIGR02147 family protein, partial [Deltaproteobacteria bacterium]|nr:TIGR02147 family protein [Deltaproteobacteria bacterium]
KFTDPKDFLSHTFKEKQKKNPKYSLRSWSGHLGFRSPSVISMVLRGERKLQLELLTKIAESLRLTDPEKQYLQVLTLYSNAITPAEKQLYSDLLGHIRPDQEFSTLHLDKFRLISDWYHFAIYEMVDLKDFKLDYDWISQKLNHEITSVMAEEAIKRFLRLKLLVLKNGKLKKNSQQQVFTETDIPNEALKKHHTQMIEKALQSLQNQDVQEREISSNTMIFSKSKMAEVKRKIRKFQKEIARLCETKQGDAVYQLNTQFFKLTKGGKK